MILTKSRIFLISCLVFISGVALASFLPTGLLVAYQLWLFIGVTICFVFMILYWQYKVGAMCTSLLPLFFLFLSLFFLAVWRHSLSLPIDVPNKIVHYNGKNVSLVGLINNKPDIRQINQKLEIKVKSLQQQVEVGQDLPQRKKISGKVLITTNLYPTYEYGDELEIGCKLEAPEGFNDFAYDRYLARYGIYSVCYYPKIKISKTGQGNWLYGNIFKIKDKLENLIDYGLVEPESSLARPIIFGGQKGLDDELRQQFSRLGLTHIMAVSGFNISILAAIVVTSLLAIGLARRQAFYLTVFILAVYVVLVGLPASAMRAGLMGGLVLWALHLGRLNKLTNSLVLTAAILLLINPKLLRDDVGFQLSFLAILGLVYVYPLLENLFEKIKIPELKGIRSILSMTIAAQVFTWPIMAYNFSQVSLIAPLSNLLIIWAIPFLTIVILIALGLSLIMPGLAFLFFLPALIILKYILLIVKLLVKIPYGYIEINSLFFSWWGWLVIYYIVSALVVLKVRKRLEKNCKIV